MAELLEEAVVVDPSLFTPSPDEYDAICYDYDDKQATVLAVLEILKQAQLPIPTFALAVLILRRLKSRFYTKWINSLTLYGRVNAEEVENTKELVIIAAIVLTHTSRHR